MYRETIGLGRNIYLRVPALYGGHQLEIACFFSRSLSGFLVYSTVLFVIQVTIVHMSSLKAVEAGRITVSRLPTRGRPWSSRGIRFALRASSHKHSRRDFRCSAELVAR